MYEEKREVQRRKALLFLENHKITEQEKTAQGSLFPKKEKIRKINTKKIDKKTRCF